MVNRKLSLKIYLSVTVHEEFFFFRIKSKLNRSCNGKIRIGGGNKKTDVGSKGEYVFSIYLFQSALFPIAAIVCHLINSAM